MNSSHECVQTKAVSKEFQQWMCENNTMIDPCLYDVTKAHLWVPICIGEIPNMHYKVHIIVYHISSDVISSGTSPATISADEWWLCCSSSVKVHACLTFVAVCKFFDT